MCRRIAALDLLALAFGIEGGGVYALQVHVILVHARIEHYMHTGSATCII